jgi:hypothetical protein
MQLIKQHSYYGHALLYCINKNFDIVFSFQTSCKYKNYRIEMQTKLSSANIFSPLIL